MEQAQGRCGFEANQYDGRWRRKYRTKKRSERYNYGDKLKQMMEDEIQQSKSASKRVYRAALLLIWKASVHLSRHPRSHLIMEDIDAWI